jgi:hypothetical protein
MWSTETPLKDISHYIAHCHGGVDVSLSALYFVHFVHLQLEPDSHPAGWHR